jgi:hypothetical protein
VGGRCHSIELNGVTHEIGASFIIEINHYLHGFIKQLGLATEHPEQRVGFYRKSEIAFMTSEKAVMNLLKFLAYYHFDFLKLYWNIQYYLDNLENLYANLDRNQSYDTLYQILK